MKLSIKKLMQLKNEVSKNISQAQSMSPSSPMDHHIWMPPGENPTIEYGTSKVDGEVVVLEGDTVPFHEYYERYERLLDTSEILHGALSWASNEAGIPDYVRRRQNLLSLIKVNQQALKRSKPYTRQERASVAGGGVETVHKSFDPYVPSGALKARIKELKAEVRELQARIDEANLEEVVVDGVTEESIESLLE